MKTTRTRDLTSIEGAVRERFEEAAYAQYFMTFAGAFMAAGGLWAPRGAVDPMIEKDEFLKRKEDGCYITETLDSAWWGWYANEINRE